MVTESNNSLKLLFSSEKKYSFLVGSGVSVDPPTNFPTGKEFCNELLPNILPSIRQQDFLQRSNSQELLNQIGVYFIRFEWLNEKLSKFDPNLSFLDDFGESKIWNYNHKALAKLILNGHKVMTTNFDNLIECAIFDEGIKKEQIFPVIYKEDWEKAVTSNLHKIFKFHGSIKDFRTDTPSKDTIKATVAHIIADSKGAYALPFFKNKILQDILQSHDLIVIGYSGLDDFDIFPSMKNVHSDKKVFWIKHDPKRIPQNAIIENMSDRSNVYSDDRIIQNLDDFIANDSRKSENIYRIHVDTSMFMEFLCNSVLGIEFLLKNHNKKEIHSSSIHPRVPQLSEAQKWYLAAELNDPNLYFDEFYNDIKTALEIAPKENNPDILISCLVAYGGMCTHPKFGHNFKEAETYYLEALEVCQKNGLKRDEIECNLILGQLFRVSNNLKKAKRYCDKVMKQLEQELSNVNPTDHLKILFLKNIQSSLYNCLGNYYSNLNKYDDSFYFYEKALEIDNEVGRIHSKLQILYNISQTYMNFGKLEEALKTAEEAIDIAVSVGDQRKICDILNIYAHYFLSKHNMSRAIGYFEEAKNRAKKYQIYDLEVRELLNLANIYVSRGDRMTANDYLRNANNTVEKAGLTIFQTDIENLRKKIFS